MIVRRSAGSRCLVCLAISAGTPIAYRRDYLENAAAFGLTEVIWDLVEYLNTTKESSKRDQKWVFEWLKQLPARIDGYTHYVTGNCISEGWGTAKSDSEAINQHMLTAEQWGWTGSGYRGTGFPLGQENLQGQVIFPVQDEQLVHSNRQVPSGSPRVDPQAVRLALNGSDCLFVRIVERPPLCQQDFGVFPLNWIGAHATEWHFMATWRDIF